MAKDEFTCLSARLRTKTCIGCATTFHYEIGRGKDRCFCTKRCMQADCLKRRKDRKDSLPPCTIPDCTARATRVGDGLCELHYMRKRRHGSPEIVLVDKNIYQACVYCGKKGKTKYCSGRCKSRYMRGNPLTATCRVCGTVYLSARKRQCCSPECGAEWERQQDRIRRKKKWRNAAYRERLLSYMKSACKRRRDLIDSDFEEFANEDVFKRDKWRCWICGKIVDRDAAWPHPNSPSIDHVIPLSLGGGHRIDNVHCAHLRCNLAKNDRMLTLF